MLIGLLLYGLLFFGLPFVVLRFFVNRHLPQPASPPRSHGDVSDALTNSSLGKSSAQEDSTAPRRRTFDKDERIGANNTSNTEKKDLTPKVVIAYATYSQSSLILAHKLLNFLTNILQEQDSYSKSTCACASNGESSLSGGCACSSGRARGETKPSSNGKEGASSSSLPNSLSCGCARRRVAPIVKVLELAEDPVSGDSAGSGNRTGGLTTFGVDMLLEDPSYVLNIFIVSTFSEGKAPPRSQAFEIILKDAFEDHRIPRDALARKRFAVFGLGDLAYGANHFNAFAKHLHEWCRGLGAPSFVVPPVYASQFNTASLFQMFTLTLERWVRRTTFYDDYSIHSERRGGAKRAIAPGGSRSVSSARSSRAPSEAAVDFSSDEEGEGAQTGDAEAVDDVEDLVSEAAVAPVDPDAPPPPLLYPKLEQNLTKQGYRLVGSHSAVKLCRWTKSMLRGRGGCYKHTFYNINSSQCMEMTPSLACANKCVFCWRHHTNPVSRSFRWRQDPPERLIAGGMAAHYQMIKQMRGVPGVTPERLAAAMEIRHCALSLVGEPIMYPQINAFCGLLHARRISSFMVTNAQFPEQLRELRPVTQLYLSVDAATPEELRRIDRPLFEDYWERCLACVAELRRKRQRTVFRLTLVNAYNSENVVGYADLVERAWPDFIEVKGVTYCGTSPTSTLTMKENVPRHEEVIAFCEKLCEELARRRPGYVATTMVGAERAEGKAEEEEEDGEDPEAVLLPPGAASRPYHIACEHEHSCCVLIALDKFYFNRRWHTWIDYDRFHDLVAAAEARRKALPEGEEDEETFTSLDYAAPTPLWATYRSKEKGFDPEQTRVIRKNGRPGAVTSGC
ncbi:unnamed protein product [Phytomonas sp. EM1]|nr:unnamed protein product [Phytomonas sp. EM1]|eukprot:CCW61322.1 unnamed protein product [Phytomonas sp. isolate EM1]